jgi:tetratricopeptide (TPR) repeat protein
LNAPVKQPRAPAAGASLAEWGVILLVLVSTLGEGGADPDALLLWHAWLAAMVVLALLGSAPRRIPARGPTLGYLALVAVAIVGAARAPYAYAAGLFLVELAAFGAVVWLAARAGPTTLTRCRAPLAIVAAAQSALFLTQRFALGQVRPAGTMLNPNHLAAWLLAALLLVVAAWGVGERPSRLERLCLVPVVAALATIGSRGALLGLLAGATVLVVSGWSDWKPRRRRLVVALALLAVVALGSGIAIRLRQFDPFRYQRVRIWSAVAEVVAEHPWTGCGPRQFAWVARNLQFPDGDGPLRFDRGFRTTHSDWLRVPTELGWPGTLALVAGLLAAIPVVLRAVRNRVPGAVGAVAALTALAAQAGVENLSLRPAVYLLAASLTGGLLSVEPAAARSPSRAARWVGTFLVAVGLLVVEVAPYLAWRAAQGLPDGPLRPAQLDRLRTALQRNPLQPDYWRKLAEHLSADGGVLDLDRYAEAREAAERAVRLNPLSSESLRGLARVEARACTALLRDEATRRRASEAYLEAERVDRFNPFIPLELAGFLLDTGNVEGARAAARRVLELEPESVRPRLLLAAAELGAEGGSVAEAKRFLEEATTKAVEWRDRSTGTPYAEGLLTLDPADARRIERRLASAKAGGGAVATP